MSEGYMSAGKCDHTWHLLPDETRMNGEGGAFYKFICDKCADTKVVEEGNRA